MVGMARVMGGRAFKVIIGICVFVKLCFACSSATATLPVHYLLPFFLVALVIAHLIAFNTWSSHAMCIARWMGISAVCCWLLCLPRTFKFVAYVGTVSTISI